MDLIETARGEAHVIGVGAQTPVGLSLRPLLAATRAGINRFNSYDRLRLRRDGELVAVSALGTLGAAPLHDRLVSLGVAAAQQALRPWRQAIVGDRDIVCLLAGQHERPGLDAAAQSSVYKAFLGALDLEVDTARSGIFRSDHCGAFVALLRALSIVAGPKARPVLLGGFDSFIDVQGLHYLESLGRVASSSSPNTFIPGEGAAFLLLAPEAWAGTHGLKSIAVVRSASVTSEPRPWYVAGASDGAALTRVIRAAAAMDEGAPTRVPVTYSDFDGARWRADEWGLAYTRTGVIHGHPLDHRHPASAWGNVGVASGPLLLANACGDFHEPDASHQAALVLCSSDFGGVRAACVVTHDQRS